jgi:murein DD-endopeptidase MepM/ murein hydrolase activator NlpD
MAFWVFTVFMFCVITFVPKTASANVFSLFTPVAQADTSTDGSNSGIQNSQKMALATPSIGPGVLTKDAVSNGDVDIQDKGTAIDPTMGPAGSALDVANLPTGDQVIVYTVHKADTLAKVAQLFDVSIGTIVAANDLTPGQSLVPGTILNILPTSGQEYVVKDGDTLKSIAKKFSKKNSKISPNDIAFNNDITSDADLVAGDMIIIPDPDFDVAPTPTKNSDGNIPQPKPTNTKLPSVSGFVQSPVPGGIITQRSHGYKMRGVDIGAHFGTPILSVASGTVIIAISNGNWNQGYGNYVVIDHVYNGQHYQTLSGHMSEVDVTPGQTVTAGQVIGKIGMSGHTTGPHLHIEFRGVPNPFAVYKKGATVY